MILLSPAKTFAKNPQPGCASYPFPKETSYLVNLIKSLYIREIVERFKVSEKIAIQVYDTYQAFGETSYKVSSLYAGEVFKALDFASLNHNEQLYAENNLLIFSALYGLLKPQDSISKYRLDMKTNLSGLVSEPLLHLWLPKIEASLTGKTIINLSSNEFSSLLSSNLDVVTIDFRLIKENEIKSVSMYSKKLRGLMARKLIQEQTYDLTRIQNWSIEGYTFNPLISTEKKLFFSKAVQ